MPMNDCRAAACTAQNVCGAVALPAGAPCGGGSGTCSMGACSVPTPFSSHVTSKPDGWANNVAVFLSHIQNINGGFYDGGWNYVFASTYSASTKGGIGVDGFGQGIVVGVPPPSPAADYLFLTDGIWATLYLQASGGPAGALAATQGNGVTTTNSGDFGHQVMALKFNVDFSDPPAGSNVPPGYYVPSGFGGLRLMGTGSSLDGFTVTQILAAANLSLGNGPLPAGFTYDSFNMLLGGGAEPGINGAYQGGASAWAFAHLY
jgi:hypothetical protein